MNLVILPELEEFIIPLQKDEYAQLEQNIKEEGCREPLTIWANNNKYILIDGHNRYKICNKYGISFNINKLKFENIENVKIWIINNQLGRRNLNPDQLSYFRGLKYERLKQNKGGYKAFLSKGQKGTLTSEKLAKEFKVSERTIKRDSKYARGLDFIGGMNPLLRKMILNGDSKITKSGINLLGNPENQKRIRKIINENDLEYKIEKIRSEALGDIVGKLEEQESQEDKLTRQANELKESLKFDEADRIKKIKGMILSNLNKAIKEKDIDVLDEIRKLVDRLQDILA